MKITIEMDYDLEQLKTCYRNFYQYPKNHKVTKADIANFLANLVNADMQDLEGEYDND